jgi:hypothetical protein
MLELVASVEFRVIFPEVRNEFDVVSDVGLELAEALAQFVCRG